MVCAVLEIENRKINIVWEEGGGGGVNDSKMLESNFTVRYLNTFVAHCSEPTFPAPHLVT